MHAKCRTRRAAASQRNLQCRYEKEAMNDCWELECVRIPTYTHHTWGIMCDDREYVNNNSATNTGSQRHAGPGSPAAVCGPCPPARLLAAGSHGGRARQQQPTYYVAERQAKPHRLLPPCVPGTAHSNQPAEQVPGAGAAGLGGAGPCTTGHAAGDAPGSPGGRARGCGRAQKALPLLGSRRKRSAAQTAGWLRFIPSCLARGACTLCHRNSSRYLGIAVRRKQCSSR